MPPPRSPADSPQPHPPAAVAVPFMDLARLHRPLAAEFHAALDRLLASSAFILGEEVALFEQEFAAATGARHAVGLNSGLDAITLVLKALDIGPGDQVITQANTFIATVLAILQTGATPVLVDCLPDSLAIDPDRVATAINKHTKALLPVHLYGRICDIAPLAQLAERHGLALIEDAAQAHLAQLDGRRAGAFGRAGCFSFYPAKNLGALGDAGLVVTDDPQLAARVRHARDYGQAAKYHHTERGVNSRLDTLQAAFLRVKLRHLAGHNHHRRQLADGYYQQLRSLPLQLPALPRSPLGEDHVHHLLPVLAARRDELREQLASRGIQTGIHYPLPAHLQPALAFLGLGPGSFPVAEATAAQLLSLPLFPGMTPAEHATVCQALADCCAG